MLVKTRGIVIRTVKYSETSLICDIYTQQLGLQTYIVSGVRQRRAKIAASLLQVTSILDLVVYHRENKEINRTKEIKPYYVYQSIPFKLNKGAIGLFNAELIKKTVKEATSNLELYEFIERSFILLDSTPHPVANFHLFFMIHLSSYLGFMPSGDYIENKSFFDLKEGVYCTIEPIHGHFLRPRLSVILYAICQRPLNDAHLLQIDRTTRKTLLQKFIQYYQYRVEGFQKLNTLEIFQEVF